MPDFCFCYFFGHVVCCSFDSNPRDSTHDDYSDKVTARVCCSSICVALMYDAVNYITAKSIWFLYKTNMVPVYNQYGSCRCHKDITLYMLFKLLYKLLNTIYLVDVFILHHVPVNIGGGGAISSFLGVK